MGEMRQTPHLVAPKSEYLAVPDLGSRCSRFCANLYLQVHVVKYSTGTRKWLVGGWLVVELAHDSVTVPVPVQYCSV